MQTILTGVRANEEPTIGNFLGAYKSMINLAHEHAADSNINMFVPDLHSFTTPIDHDKLYDQVIKGVKYYIAAGLDINNPNIHICRQSHVPAHSELAWVLDCFTPFGEASRMTQFKEKSEEHSNAVTVGLFNYPILMAADILLYDAKYIPLGEDQFQHLELARNIGIRMNNKFDKELFTIPAPEKEQVKFMHLEKGLRIRSLVDPTKKMSKSDENVNAWVAILDKPEDIMRKFKRAVTDSDARVCVGEGKDGINNLIGIYSAITKKSAEQIAIEFEGKGYGDFKTAVAESVIAELSPVQAEYKRILADKAYLEGVLKEGAAHANAIADRVLSKVYRKAGFMQL
jgi:tryptophanyl-tRNA synthetase